MISEGMTDKKKGNPISLRLDETMRRKLEKEGRAMGHRLASYIRHLIVTHQDRKKTKRSA